VDDNCNGVIDEGCGEPTGALQFVIAWAAAQADVNLTLLTPSHERVPGEHDRGAAGGAAGFREGRDCPGEDGCGGQNVETIFFEGTEVPHGHYIVEIALADLHGEPPPVKVRFGARLGSYSIGFDVEVAPGDGARKIFSFDVP
jgi:tRNA (guanosine-2'-O-)-methyltransferase